MRDATIVYLNGKLLPLAEARLSPLDHGFLYGYSLFETMRAYGGRFFRQERHLARLAASARALGMACPDANTLRAAVSDTLEANGLKEARLRLTLSPGEAEAVPNPRAYGTPTLLVQAQPYTPPAEADYALGYRGHISAVPIFSRSPEAGHKTSHYLPYILGRREALAAGANEALFCNEKGALAEGGTTNLFLVAGAVLSTPALGSGPLPGVTREAILELATSLGLKAEEREIYPQELAQAEEAFLCNSVLEVMALTAVNGKALGPGQEGPLTQRLRRGYRALVARETASP
ncbi:MAG: aminotransferase class IV [Chloroflexi bacterium]|nr:aminotransferase class IV [Chloroflexota bacterium]